MRVLVVGNGAREHALVWRLKQSPGVKELYAAPGNVGMAGLATLMPIESSSIIELADFAAEFKVGLTVVGPELPLTLGITDEFHKRGLRVLGPTRAAAEIEGSKVFSKRLMKAHGIPTADFEICTSAEEASAHLDRRGNRFPVVLKVDGLAGGKGVVVAPDRATADDAVARMLVARSFGNAAARVVIEDFLEGTEISFQVLAHGLQAIPLAVARDWKRAQDGDLGPNTGGMGSISPSRALTPELGREIMQTVVSPTLKALDEDGRSFSGVLYVGLVLTAEGPRVLEYNARFGDPETQSIMSRLESDPLELFLAAATGHLETAKPVWKKEVSVSVVVASGGYPGEITTGHPIEGLDELDPAHVQVFHAGTALVDGKLVTAAGRVLTVNACAPNRPKAIERVYAAVEKIHFEGMHYRRDIGAAEDALT